MRDYTDKERLIFGPYWDGAGERFADPKQAYRRLIHALDGDPNKYLRAIKSQSEPERFEAMERLIDASRAVFEMAPFDPGTGGGATDTDCLNVVRDFLHWIDDQKKSTRMTPICPE